MRFILCVSLLTLPGFLQIAGAQTKEYTNPILAGFYPDPSICRVGEDYYLVTSTFSYFPGIPVFQSRDLVSWKLIGHVMDRPEQLNLDGQGVSRGLFAPSIRYYNGLFYVTCTQVDRGGNFIVTSKSAEGPWSNPVWLPEVNGIDPSPFFDDDGRAYLIYNSAAPDDKPLYDGHRTIRIRRLDLKKLEVSGDEKILINGGVDISKKPVWIEAPHIFKKDGYYYLIAAEGGTAEQHSEVVFRSKSVDGPYVPYEKNPILTQRHLDPRREFPITSTGHADLVQANDGSWWAVFLGCRPYRPYEGNYYNTGRETFMAPVSWKEDWPIINPGSELVRYRYPLPMRPSASGVEIPMSGNFTVRDEFTSEKLNAHWTFLRTPRELWYDLRERKGWLALRVRPQSWSEAANPTFLGRRQQHLRGSASVELDFSAGAESEKAGLLVFQSEQHFYFLCKSVTQATPVVQLYRSEEATRQTSNMELLASQELGEEAGKKPLGLRIDANGGAYSFLYSTQPGKWIPLKEEVDGRFLSTRVAGGFVGCMFAMYATSLAAASKNTAFYNWFEYTGRDETY
jgi:alpha-N-arabinofuranosidase